jgi:5-methyltetrahydropteroyltriglutamate--homocysteine methyltransferase
MRVLVDDVGSFPLPSNVSKEAFAKAYPRALKAYAEGRELAEDEELYESFYKPVAASLRSKVRSGLDVVNYPQHYDMHRQFLEPILEYQEEPFLIREKYAVIPELYVVEREAEKYGKLRLKVCVTGPVELHLKTEFGFHIYEEILGNLALSVNRFLRNSMLNTGHVETAVVAIDEPSLGFVDLLNIDEEGLVKALEASARGIKARVQVHLHTLKAARIPLAAKGIEVITGEFAAAPENMQLLARKTLEEYGKYLRAGISRTNVDSIIAEHAEHGVRPSPEQLVEEVKVIRKRYEKISEVFSDRLAFVGPDCGLGAWPSQRVAQLLLKHTVSAVKFQ